MPRWIQCPDTNKLIPAEEFDRPKERHHMIMTDIKPFRSTVDGTVVSTRSQLEAHNKRNNVTNSSDFSPEYVKGRARQKLRNQAKADKQDRVNTLRKALYERG